MTAQVKSLPSFLTAYSPDDRPSLPPLGHELSRPSSTASSQASYPISQSRQSSGSQNLLQLPGLRALASLASTSATGGDHYNRNHHHHHLHSPIKNGHDGSSARLIESRQSMTYATSAPATSGGGSTSPPICQNCTTSTTPLWRRDEVGSVLCNACGLFLKLHGRPRPISLKTDVIKSRNRVKASIPGQRKKIGYEANGHMLPRPSTDANISPDGVVGHRRTSQKTSSGASDHSHSPISRTGTPSLNHNPSNIAPQHMFDSVTLDGHAFHPSSNLPNFGLRQPSPSASSLNGSAALEQPLAYDALLATNNALKTRVSELEVINDLFRGRVAELEQSEQEARRAEAAARDTETRLRKELEEVSAREAALKRRFDDAETELSDAKDGQPRQKKMRLSDIVDESRASTPLSITSQPAA